MTLEWRGVSSQLGRAERSDGTGMNDEDDEVIVDCREVLQNVYHFLDGELTSHRRDQIAEHLNRCGPCFKAFGFETELRRLIANRCRDQVPDELRVRIAAAIAHEHGQKTGTGGLAERAGN